MKLTGIIHTLGGFHTIRGFAKLNEIAYVSEVEDFQRDLIPEHKDEIKEYYLRKKDLFFPEIVLSHTLKYDFSKVGAISGINPLNDIVLAKKDFTSNIDSIKFKPLKTEVGSQRVIEITIDDEWLKLNKPFSRIDGNHRISAYLEPDEHKPFDEFVAPFCIVLLDDTVESKKSKKVVFHNINSKARNLTTEEELKSIISDDDFTDAELTENFGKNYFYTRLLKNGFNGDLSEILLNVYNAFLNSKSKDFTVTVFFKLITFLVENKLIEKEEDIISIVVPAIQKVNGEFFKKEKIVASHNSAFFIASVGIELYKKMNVSYFVSWLSKNQLGDLEEIKAQSIFDIYLKINEHNPKVFVAMPYFSEDEIATYNSAYQRVITKINEDASDIIIDLIPIMMHKGGTKDIVVDMFDKIDNSDIFIADISRANANVAYELGYARSKQISTIIVRRTGDEIEVPFDYEHDIRKPYNPLALDTLENSVYEDIKALLIEKGYSFN
jgi:nucleoside 2-deoxyribosyltransferase